MGRAPGKGLQLGVLVVEQADPLHDQSALARKHAQQPDRNEGHDGDYDRADDHVAPDGLAVGGLDGGHVTLTRGRVDGHQIVNRLVDRVFKCDTGPFVAGEVAR